MELKYWIDRWTSNDIRFHQEEYEPLLVRYFSLIDPGNVLVPLCGKSRDMLWLADNGWNVVGVEASPIACRAFFEENALKHREEKHCEFKVFRGDKITLWCGDFFKTCSTDLGCITAIYDRAALIALPPDIRPKYAGHIAKLVEKKSIRALLITIEYSAKIQGPPFSVMAEEVHRIYKPNFDVEEIEREEDLNLPNINPKFKDSRVFETAFRLVSR